MGDLFTQRYCDVHSLSDSEYAWFALTYLLERHALLIRVTPTMYISDARAKLRTLPLLADASDLPTFEDYGADEDDCIDEWLSIYNEGLEERGYSLVELVDDETEEMHLVCVPLCVTEELACLARSAGQEISRYE
ncbi:hypothetical protein EII11_07200 [Schaalia canis]|uniref:DUF6630 domain-containing protein n=2 Tax=Schaalia canis TaxID=100469 RepID=A0A3P1SE49_9ACTO|nr:hypothetical protein [Schaalia canis]RRC95180.1 hypothetical protein EII11_07200 [Schaalia canis]